MEEIVGTRLSPDGRRRLTILRRRDLYTTQIEVRRAVDGDGCLDRDLWVALNGSCSFYADPAIAEHEAMTTHQWLTQELPVLHRDPRPRTAAPVAGAPSMAAGPAVRRWLPGLFEAVVAGSLSASVAAVWATLLTADLGNPGAVLWLHGLAWAVAPLLLWPSVLVAGFLPLVLYYALWRALAARWRPTVGRQVMLALAFGAATNLAVCFATSPDGPILWLGPRDGAPPALFPYAAIQCAFLAAGFTLRRRWLGLA